MSKDRGEAAQQPAETNVRLPRHKVEESLEMRPLEVRRGIEASLDISRYAR